MIDPVKPGGWRTMLSTRLANAVIRVCNMVLGMRGGPGIRVHIADANIVIELDRTVPTDSDNQGVATGGTSSGGGSGMVDYQGEWVSTTAYSVYQIIKRSYGLFSGTYLCLVATTGDGTADEKPETGTRWVLLGRMLDQSFWG